MPALFIGRFQPFHNGHLEAIKWILRKKKKVLIIIGSLQESSTKNNPFSFKERKEMIERSLLNAKIKNYKIYGIPDLFDDILWAKKVLGLTKVKKKEVLVFTQNSWTKECFEKIGAKVLPHPLFFNGLSGVKIRKKIFKNERWENLVPVLSQPSNGAERIKFLQVLPEKRIVDFIRKTLKKAGLKGGIMGISGGIDSSVTACLAKKALGKKVIFLQMPFTKSCSLQDNVSLLKKKVKIKAERIYLGDIYENFLKVLPEGNKIVKGNLKPRLRMAALYYFANLFNLLVIGTTNKSEMEIGYFCYDERTKALTKEGLKKYFELKPGDIVFSINPKTKQLIETRIKDIYIFDYKGEMLSYGGGRYSKAPDLMITPNHRLLIEKKGKIEFCSAEKLPRHSYPTPTFKPWEGQGDSPSQFEFNNRGIGFNARRFSFLSMKDFLYILGLYIGDGNACISSITHSVKISKDRHWRDPKTGRFVYKNIPSHPKRYPTHRTWFSLPKGTLPRSKLISILRKNNIKYGLRPTALWVYGKPFSRAMSICGHRAHEKQIPQRILNYPAKYLESLLEGLLESDGDKRNYYYTVSKKLAEQLAELGYKLGKNVTIRTRPPRVAQRKDGIEIRSSENYEISFFGNGRRWLNGAKFKKVFYKSTVWCPDIPETHNLLVERNGRFLFCGNTKFGDGGADVEPIADLYKTEVIEMAKRLKLPKEIIETVPTASLWSGQTDKKEIGLDYRKLDTVLKLLFQGFKEKEISFLTDIPRNKIKNIIERKRKNIHKLSLPPICKLKF